MLYNDFLNTLMKNRHRTLFARITSLSLDELPKETVEGRITSGSINVDGDSAVRRTCQLSMVANGQKINDYLWSLNTKFNLEIGILNTIDRNYPDIIWLKQGVFVITSFSMALSVNSYTISISGKDKMCLLNGENGGTLPFEVNFGVWEEIDQQGNTILHQNPLKDIIREAIHHYGEEPFHNIIINDLDDRGLELQQYAYDTPLYLIRPADEQNNYIQATLDGEQNVFLDDNSPTTLEALEAYDILLSSNPINTIEPTVFYYDTDKDKKVPYCAAKIEYGQTVGYTPTEMVYTGDLIAKAGETITSVLDKITKMLSNFEYFYDLDGRFVFQEKKNYLNTSWSPLRQTEEGLTYVITYNDKIQFHFYDNELITSFNSNPNLANLKNDYAIWGQRNNNIPIHLRYAIDVKPTVYTSISIKDDHQELINYNKKYNTFLLGQKGKTYKAKECDWRELIYQMALDYRKYGHLDCFEQLLREANKDNGLYQNGKTGYEQYYIDLEGFWRQLYNNEGPIYSKVINPDKKNITNYYEKIEEFTYVSDAIGLDAGTKVYIKVSNNTYARVRPPYNGKVNRIYGNTLYIVDNEQVVESKFIPNGNVKDTILTLADPVAIESPYFILNTRYNKLTEEDELQEGKEYYSLSEQFYPKDHINKYWNKNVYESPDLLNFWFDFLDTDGELSKYSVRAVGRRPKVQNEQNVKSIYYLDTPEIIFLTEDDETIPNNYTGYSWLRLPKNCQNMFRQSSQGKSAKNVLDDALYTHSYCTESVTITAIPIYHLQPNQRIVISDGIYGIGAEYLVSKITIPLTYNGTMNITATKVMDRII